MEELSLFDFLPEREKKKFAYQISNDWKWKMSEDYPLSQNGLKVLSCFAGGGGSTMGYKLAGCTVLGCVELDKQMNEIYIRNHNPKYNFLMDIREFNALPAEDIPPELFELDILDGSPPCTTFSIAGEREKNWGKTKKFREGQKEQTLDDLSFVFIETAKKLRPKVVIMENVEGLLLGEAWKYVQRIYSDFKKAGYQVHHWLLKGERMGIPQRRHRAIFVAVRSDLNINPAELNMNFFYKPVTFGEIRSPEGRVPERGKTYLKLMEQRIESDRSFKDLSLRIRGTPSGFCNSIVHDEDVCTTITAKGLDFRYCDGLAFSALDLVHAQTFPEDYDFTGIATQYVIGMSVPPVMIKRVVERLINQGVFKYREVSA